MKVARVLNTNRVCYNNLIVLSLLAEMPIPSFSDLQGRILYAYTHSYREMLLHTMSYPLRLAVSSDIYPSPSELNEILLSAMLEVRAWALARPAAEQYATEDAISLQIGEVQRTHDEQGRFHSLVGEYVQARLSYLFHNTCFSAWFSLFITKVSLSTQAYLPISSLFSSTLEQTRVRLLNFIQSIKSALAALTTGI